MKVWREQTGTKPFHHTYKYINQYRKKPIIDLCVPFKKKKQTPRCGATSLPHPFTTFRVCSSALNTPTVPRHLHLCADGFRVHRKQSDFPTSTTFPFLYGHCRRPVTIVFMATPADCYRVCKKIIYDGKVYLVLVCPGVDAFHLSVLFSPQLLRLSFVESNK